MKIRKQIVDTSSEAEAVLVQLIRKQDPAKRLADAVSASNRVALQCKDAIIRANPEFSTQQVNLRFIELNYGQELADSVRNFLAQNK